jgi:glycosyltransferase involved in cell wall biosynthesis
VVAPLANGGPGLMAAPDGDGLRVLLACEWFAKYTTGMARGLADHDCDVTLLSRDHDLEFGNEPGAMQAFVDGLLGGHGRHIAIGGRVRDLRQLRRVGAVRRALDAWGPDVVHVQDSLTHDLRLAVAGGYPWGRFALTVHDPVPHPGDPEPTARIRYARRLLRRQATLTFVHSDDLAAELIGTGDVRGAVEVVPLPFLGEVEATAVPTAPSMLFFGRISHYKGLDTLLDALPRVWEKIPDATLTVAGHGDLPESPLWEDPRVELRFEHIPEEALAGLFAAARCVVLPYRQASQSGVGALSQQYGRASVGTAVGGLPDALGGGAGRIVSPEDPPALATALVEVLGEPGVAEEMGRIAEAGGRESTWSNVSGLVLDAYRRHLL